jgi:hypothetical protein
MKYLNETKGILLVIVVSKTQSKLITIANVNGCFNCSLIRRDCSNNLIKKTNVITNIKGSSIKLIPEFPISILTEKGVQKAINKRILSKESNTKHKPNNSAGNIKAVKIS